MCCFFQNHGVPAFSSIHHWQKSDLDTYQQKGMCGSFLHLKQNILKWNVFYILLREKMCWALLYLP